MGCVCENPAAAAERGTLKAFLFSEDHMWVTTAWHLCLSCQAVWSDDEERGWRREAFETLRDPTVWVTGVMGVYPEHELTDVDTFARWVKKLAKPHHTCPMV